MGPRKYRSHSLHPSTDLGVVDDSRVTKPRKPSFHSRMKDPDDIPRLDPPSYQPTLSIGQPSSMQPDPSFKSPALSISGPSRQPV